MTLPTYGKYNEFKNIYPAIKKFRYPKAGRNNPTVKLWVVDLARMDYARREIIPPEDYIGQDFYFTSVQWVSNSKIAVIWLRRSQNSSSLSMCEPLGAFWPCSKHMQHESYGNGWVDMFDKPVFTDDSSYYFLRLPQLDEKALYFRHIQMVKTDGGDKKFLTEGLYDVTKILTYFEINETLFYLSTIPEKPEQRHLFSVSGIFSDPSPTEECHTCDLEIECTYNNAIFSPGAKYYILECLGPDVPWLDLRVTESHERLERLDNNDNVKDSVDNTAMPQLRTFNVPIEGGYNANVRLLLPPGLKDAEVTKYPMVVNVYGDPGDQKVTDEFSVHWGSYLASKKNFVYSWIDGRGSGNQGDKRLHEIYRKLGTTDVADQLKVASYLKNEIPFIDRYKTAIWGWSYGGYSTIMALATDSQVFNCGIAVAPITSWLYYDSAYSERYMQTPDPLDNYKGYEEADVTRKASQIKDKKLLLIHGTADDNVHAQQSLMLMKAITDAGVMYRAQVYPDEKHSLSNVKGHLYRTMENFLDNCFGLPEEDEKPPPPPEEEKRR